MPDTPPPEEAVLATTDQGLPSDAHALLLPSSCLKAVSDTDNASGMSSSYRPECDDVGDRGFLKAPKRGRQSRRPLLERPRSLLASQPTLEAEVCVEDVDVETQEDIRSELGVWCQAAASNALANPVPPRVNADAKAVPAPVQSALPPAAPAASAPLWARWQISREATSDRHLNIEEDAEGVDHWASAPGASFERICIGFKDVGEEDRREDEASTCDGEEPEEEASDADELEVLNAEVVIGYRADVDEGVGFPDDESEGLLGNEEGYAGVCAVEGGPNLEADEAAVLVDGSTEGADWGGVIDRPHGLQAMVAALMPDRPKVTHVLFVVHGMGATAEALVQNVRDLSDSLQDMQKYWFWHTNIEVHVEMIDWKSTFSAEQSMIFDRITPAEARDRRMSLNSTLSDVIFYKTAHHRSKIHDIVTQKMNARVRTLRSETSGRFSDARISIVGHSLGSVISYDVLSDFGRDGDSNALDFEIDNFFLWGSPLAAFVSIADIEHQHGKFVLPDSLKVCNIFHPHDPVAFRIEPLYYHSQDQIPPEMVAHWVNNGIRSNKQWARSYEYAKGLAHQKWEQLKSRVCEVVGTSSQSDLMRQEWDTFLNADQDAPMVLTAPARSSGSSAGDEAVIEETLLKPKMRIDYVLQETTVESYVESYGLLQSHFCYWTSRDVALLMLKKMSHQDTAELNAKDHELQEQAKAKAAKEAEAAEEAARKAVASGDEAPVVATSSPWSLLPTSLDVLDVREEISRRLGSVPCVGPRGLDDEMDPVGPIPMGF